MVVSEQLRQQITKFATKKLEGLDDLVTHGARLSDIVITGGQFIG